MFPIRRILVPTDFSRPSRRAFRMAVGLARDYGACLNLLHVERPDHRTGRLQGVDRDGRARPSRRDPAERLRALGVAARHLFVESRVRIGAPAAEILREAEESGSDLIVMGSHGRKPTSYTVMGRVAEQVLRSAHCPTLLVRAPVEVGTTTIATTPGAVTPKPLETIGAPCNCGRARRAKAGEVIAAHAACACTGNPAVRVHHRGFPEITGEGGSVAEGAEYLARQLVRARENVGGNWHKELLDQAICDVAEFRHALAEDAVAPAVDRPRTAEQAETIRELVGATP